MTRDLVRKSYTPVMSQWWPAIVMASSIWVSSASCTLPSSRKPVPLQTLVPVAPCVTLSGSVQLENSQAPASGVVVHIVEGTQVVSERTTDRDGHFFVDLPNSDYEVLLADLPEGPGSRRTRLADDSVIADMRIRAYAFPRKELAVPNQRFLVSATGFVSMAAAPATPRAGAADADADADAGADADADAPRGKKLLAAKTPAHRAGLCWQDPPPPAAVHVENFPWNIRDGKAMEGTCPRWVQITGNVRVPGWICLRSRLPSLRSALLAAGAIGDRAYVHTQKSDVLPISLAPKDRCDIQAIDGESYEVLAGTSRQQDAIVAANNSANKGGGDVDAAECDADFRTLGGRLGVEVSTHNASAGEAPLTVVTEVAEDDHFVSFSARLAGLRKGSVPAEGRRHEVRFTDVSPGVYTLDLHLGVLTESVRIRVAPEISTVVKVR